MVHELALKLRKGFTLIELLIVIAIIGILTVAFLPVLRGGQSKARDAARKSVVTDISATLENYINSGGNIPTDDTLTGGSGVNAGAGICGRPNTPGDWGAAAVPFGGAANGFSGLLGRTPASDMNVLPLDALCADGGIWYSAAIDNITNNYILAIQVENAGSANIEALTTPGGVNTLALKASFLALQNDAMPTQAQCVAATPCMFAVGRFE